MPREIKPKVELGLGGSFFAQVAADDVVGLRDEWRMTQIIDTTDQAIVRITNANPRWKTSLYTEHPLTLFHNPGGTGITEVKNTRVNLVRGLLPEGGMGFFTGSNITGVPTTWGRYQIPANPASITGRPQDISVLECVFSLRDANPVNGPLCYYTPSDAPGNIFGFRIQYTGTDLRIDAYYDNTLIAYGELFDVEDDQIFCIAMKLDGSTIHLFINGVEVDSGAYTPITWTAPFGNFSTVTANVGIVFSAIVIYYIDGSGSIPGDIDYDEAMSLRHYLATQWTDVTEDIRDIVPLTIEHGIRSSEPLARLASPATLFLALNNSSQNSKQTQSLYSPGHANCLEGFTKGIAIRVKSVTTDEPDEPVQFHGRIRNIDPTSGEWDEQLTYILATDFLEDATRARLNELQLLEDVRADEVLQFVVSTIQVQPTFYDLDVGSDDYEYALDNAKDERTSAYTEFNRLVMSELGYIYSTRSGGIRFENRSARLDTPSVVVPISGHFAEVDISDESSSALNQAEVTVHPRVIDTSATTTLFSLINPYEIGPGQTRSLVGPYRIEEAPDNLIRVGGFDFVALVAGTHYQMFSERDGTGIDLTSFLTATPSYGANGVSYRLRNTSSSFVGFVTKLLAVGRGVYDFRSQVLVANDPSAIASDGLNAVSVDMVYQTSPTIGQLAADYIGGRYIGEPIRALTVTIFPRDEYFPTDIVELEVGDVVYLSDKMTGIGAEYYVNGRRLEFNEGGDVRIKLWLTTRDTESYWILDVSELGVDTKLWYL